MAPEQAQAVASGTPTRGALWTGRVLGALVVLLLCMSGVMKLVRPGNLMADFTGKFGYREGALVGIALAEIASALLYAFPRTSVLGAILVTGYMGGATATHVRIGEPFVGAVIVGVAAWLGLWLRDPRLRALAPLRREP